MTKMTNTKKARKGLLPTTRNLTPEETLQLQEMIRLVGARSFEAAQLGGNTASLNTEDDPTRGKRLAADADAIAKLLDNVKNAWITQKLTECGYPTGTKCSINTTTGEVITQ